MQRNFAADFFRQKLNFTGKNIKIALSHPLGDLGATYTVHLWLVGKRVIDFLLVIIELFAISHGHERILIEIVVLERGGSLMRSLLAGVQPTLDPSTDRDLS